MKESIRITNVGPLTNIVIDDIRPFTVVIGQSGSGKSLLMKILGLMRFIYKRVNVRVFLQNSGLRRSPFRIRLDALLHDDLKFYLTRPGVRVVYTFTANSGKSYDVEISGGKVKFPKKIDDADLIFTKESWVSETRNIITSWKSNPANSRGWLGYYFHETLSDFDEAAAMVSKVDMGFLGAQLSIINSNGIRRYMLTMPDKHDAIELRYSSSGIQTAAPLSLLVQYFAREFSFKEAKRRSVLSYLYETDSLSEFHPQIELADIASVINLHIEEPELSLDPNAQIMMVKDIVRQGFSHADNALTIMFATHSPYIVNSLNVIINESDDKLKYIAGEDVAAYSIVDGELVNLMSKDNDGNWLVDTSDLTEPMERIYEDYLRVMNRN